MLLFQVLPYSQVYDDDITASRLMENKWSMVQCETWEAQYAVTQRQMCLVIINKWDLYQSVFRLIDAPGVFGDCAFKGQT